MCLFVRLFVSCRWAEAHIKIPRMTLTIKLERNWSSFQLANRAPPLSVTDSSIAPSARMRSYVSGCLLFSKRQILYGVVQYSHRVAKPTEDNGVLEKIAGGELSVPCMV